MGLFTLLGGLAIGCGGTEGGATRLSLQDLEPSPFSASAQPLSREDAEARALAIVEGRVIETRQGDERGLPVFNVHIALASGARIEVKLAVETGQVVEVEGEGGPFDVELDPGEDFLSLAEAIQIAIGLHPGEVVAWELELDESLAWKYEIEIVGEDGMLFEVELDAMTGAVMEHGPESESVEDPWDDHSGSGEIEVENEVETESEHQHRGGDDRAN